MDIPARAYNATITEGKMYFFKSDCPIGVQDHIHICIKRGDSIFLFAAGSSKVEKALIRAKALHLDERSYPIFEGNDTNKLNKDRTYIDCNNPIETSHEDFCNLMKEGKVYELPGHFDTDSLTRILDGVKISTIVESRIKQML